MLRISVALCALVLVLMGGCKSSSPTSPTTPDTPWNADSTTCTVSFTDNTVYFDSTKVSDVLANDTAAHTITISGSSTLAPQLSVGKYLLAWRMGMGQISSVTNHGSNVVVGLDSCSLDKIVKSGTIAFDYGVDFDPSKVIFPTVTIPNHGSGTMQLCSADSFGIRLDYSDYIYKIAMKLQQNTAYVKIGVEKKLLQGAFRASFSAEGTINRFRQRTSMTFANSQLQNFSHANNNMHGDLKLSLACAGSANDDLNIELPIVVAKYPVAVGPFVFFVNVKIQVVVSNVVPADASSLVDVHFSYDSDLGFNFDGVNTNPIGREGNETMERSGNMQSASSSAVTANFGIGFPRMELDLFSTGLIVPYVQPGVLINGTYTQGIHPCMSGQAAFVGAAGVNMGFAGMTLKKSYTLWKKEVYLLKSGDCP